MHQPNPGEYGVALMHLQAGFREFQPVDLLATLDELEIRIISQALFATSGNHTKAALLLKMNRTTLVSRIRLLTRRRGVTLGNFL